MRGVLYTACKAGAAPGLQQCWLCSSVTNARVAKLVSASAAGLPCHEGEGRLLGCLSSQNL